jgi:hypothetical protein
MEVVLRVMEISYERLREPLLKPYKTKMPSFFSYFYVGYVEVRSCHAS